MLYSAHSTKGVLITITTQLNLEIALQMKP
jgi:hypothetical protein